jgi:hypothetical protein
MKRSTFVLIGSIIAAIFGIGFLISPNGALTAYGVKMDPVGVFIGRYFGSALIGVAITWFLASRTSTSEGLLRAGLFGGFALGITGLVVAVWDGIAGTANSFVWINTVIYAFLTVGFAYFSFLKKTK